jgi:hypothetical protein
VVKRLMHLIHSPTGLCFGFVSSGWL